MIDFQTLHDDPPQIKRLITEYLVRHQDTLISVLDARTDQNAADTGKYLQGIRFPFDVVVANPLLEPNTGSAFKTMFAAAAQEAKDNTIVLVIDKNDDDLAMWRNSGVKFTYNPETSVQA